MLEIVGIPKTLPAIALLSSAGSLDVSCLDGCVTSHPMFVSGYRCGYDLYFDVESADPGDIVCGVPVTRMSVIESICRSTLGTNYREASDLFFWSVGACAGFLAALALYHWEEAQAGLVVLASLASVIRSYRFAFRGTNSIWAVSPCCTSLEICLSERELVSEVLAC